jgi:hypothetical protein
MRRCVPMVAVLVGLLLSGCAGGQVPSTEDGSNEATTARPSTEQSGPAEPVSGDLLQPDDLAYLGAFRLPGPSGGSNWGYSGYAATYYPDGDPQGADDGFPGSLFAIGHDQDQQVSEIDIPRPVISKNLAALNTASTLQPFAEITGGLFGYLEIPRAGLEYLPAQGQQSAGKLYFSCGQHLESELVPTHGWAELDLSAPRTAGAWRIDSYTPYVTTDYICAIPQQWADANTPGLRLATGRFRDGLWSGRGPALMAYGPWNDGDPPAPGSTLDEVKLLLLYGRQEPGSLEIVSDETMAMQGFSEADEWAGAEWLTAGGKSALVFAGTKAVGKTWYGFSNGVEYPTSGAEDETFPDVPAWPHNQRGWWAEDVQAQLLFYDPADLAAVARGDMESWRPQPYAVMSLDEYLFDPGYDYERSKMALLGDSALDRESGVLYVFERLADEGEQSIVHVFKVGSAARDVSGAAGVRTEATWTTFSD